MQIIKIDKEIPEASSKTAEQHPIAKFLSQSYKVDSHTLIELFITHPQHFHGSLANLDALSFLKVLSNTKGVFLYVDLLSNFLPFARAKGLPDVLRHVGKDKSIHFER